MALVPVLLFAFMGPWIHGTIGHYHRSVGAYTLLFLLACYAMVSIERFKPLKPRTLKVLLSLTLISFTGLVHHNPRLIYANNAAAYAYFNWATAGAMVLSIALLLLLVKEKIQRSALLAFRWISLTAMLLLVAALVLVPLVSPRPFIDVWVNNQAAVDYFLRGLNPYPQAYPDIYNGFYKYVPGFLYFPGILFWLAPFRAFFGDIRYGFVFADVLTAIGMFGLARRLKLPETLRWLFPLLWLSFPVTYFVLEQAWIDSILVCLAVLALWSAEARLWIIAGIIGGLAFAMKQYGFVITGFVLLRIWRVAGWRPAIRAAIAGAVVFLAMVLPYALWDWDAFYRSTIGGHADTEVRLDAFNFTVFMYYEMKFLIPGAARVGIAVGGILYSAWFMIHKSLPRLSDAATALVISYGMAFLFGKWAFCNYHYLLAGLVLIFLLTSAAEVGRSAPAD